MNTSIRLSIISFFGLPFYLCVGERGEDGCFVVTPQVKHCVPAVGARGGHVLRLKISHTSQCNTQALTIEFTRVHCLC